MSAPQGTQPKFMSPAEHARVRANRRRRLLIFATTVVVLLATSLSALFLLPGVAERRRLAKLSAQVSRMPEGQVQTLRFTGKDARPVTISTERWRSSNLWLERPEVPGTEQLNLPAYSADEAQETWAPAFHQLARLLGKASRKENLRFVNWVGRSIGIEISILANGSRHVLRIDPKTEQPVRWEIWAREGTQWLPVLARVFEPLVETPRADRHAQPSPLEIERLPSRQNYSDQRLTLDIRDVSVNRRGGIYLLITGQNMRFVLFTLKDGLGRSYIHVPAPDESYNAGPSMDTLRALYFAPLEPTGAAPSLPLRLALRRYRPGMVDRTPFANLELPVPVKLPHLAPGYHSMRVGNAISDQRVLLNEATTRRRVFLGLLRDREGRPVLSPMDTNVGPERLRQQPADAERALAYLEESRWRLLERSWEADWRAGYWEGKFWALRRTDRKESARVARQMALDSGATGVTDEGSELLGDPAPFLYGPVSNFPMRP